MCYACMKCVHVYICACTHILIPLLKGSQCSVLVLLGHAKKRARIACRRTLIRSECPVNREETKCSGALLPARRMRERPHNPVIG